MAYARTYGVANAMNQMTSENGTPITWSWAGDMTSDGVSTYAYTYGHRLVSASRPGMTATYDYDSDDRRTRKIVNGVMTRTLWSGADELAQLDVNGDLIRRFIPDGTGAMDSRLATVEGNGDLYWHHTDHQGSVIATSRPDGTTAGVATYSPHGEFGNGQSIPPLGSPFGYTGRQYDPETGLYQYRARYYSPKLGIFLTQDPIGTKDDPNLYLYVGADPVNATDPTGLARICASGGGRIQRCVYVDGDGDGNSRDNDLTRSQIGELSRSFSGFISNNTGADLKGYGKNVTGTATASDKSFVRATSQFVGAAMVGRGGQWKSSWDRVQSIDAKKVGFFSGLINTPAYRDPRNPGPLFLTGGYLGDGFRGNPYSHGSALARLLIHESLHSLHSGLSHTEHRRMDDSAIVFLKQSGLAGQGCPSRRGQFNGC